MAGTDRTRALVAALIDHQGQLFSEEIGAHLDHDAPVQWFHWLAAVLLLSAPIHASSAIQAAAALKAEGLHRADALEGVGRDRLIRVLNANGYARYDNQGADYLIAAARLVQERYHGDLRRLREAAGDAEGILARLKEVKGIGDIGAEIFAREAQLAWDELYPRFEGPGIEAAGDLGLPADAGKLVRLAGDRKRFVHLVAALTRVALEGPADAVAEAAV